MLRETHEKSNLGMKIYICGTICGVSGGGVGTAGGLTFDHNGYLCIALDINGSPSYDLPHELSHAFDRRINAMFNYNDQDLTDWMLVWEEFTPEYAEYTYDYANYHDYDEYTADNAMNEEVWFTSSYARVSPTEDRACIMEQLFNPAEDKLGYQFNHENILNKARLYSYILRQCFPSCNTSETHYWETYLGDINVYEE